MTTLARHLGERGAYHDLVAWAEAHGSDWDAAWRSCPRGDWLLAIAASIDDVERPAIVLAACACARLALDASESAEARDALEAAEAWARGDADLGPVVRARAALEDALERAVDPAEQATLAAALCALSSQRDPREAPGAAGNAVQANVLATGDCAFEPVVRYVHARSAELVRELVAVSLPASAR